MQTKHLSAKNIGSAINQHHRLAISLKFTVIVAAVIIFYLQDLTLVFSSALSDESTYHILAIPFLFGYLLYRKRSMINATFTNENKNNRSFTLKNFTLIIGILLCATAVLIYWFGSYTFTPIEYHMITLPIFVAGLTLIMFKGQTLKQLAFPIAFLIFLTPPPTEILYSAGSTLSDLSAHAANAMANVFGMASTISAEYGNPIITLTRPDNTIMSFSVDVACSGVYSLIGFAIFAVFIAYITRGKLWSKLAILIMGIPLIIALNIVRISTILGIGYSFGDQLALQVFHAIGATVLMFIGTLILLAVTEKIIKKPKPAEPCTTCNTAKQPEEFCPNCGKLNQFPKIKLNKSDLAKIAIIAITIALLLSIQAPVFALTKGPAQVLIQTPSGMQPNTQNLPLPPIQGYNVSYVYRDAEFEKLTKQDASLVYAYGSTNTAKPTIWVAIEIASTTAPLHRWETCLINYPISQGLKPKVTQLDLTDVQTQANPPILGRYFAFQYHSTNTTQVVLYWYETATFQLNSTSQTKHIKMSLVTYPQSPEEVTQAKSTLLPIAQAINEYWQPIKTWTTIALVISQNGLALSAASTALLIVILLYKMFMDQKEKASLQTLYYKLPKQNQLLITATTNAQKQKNPTTLGIANELEKLTNTKPTEIWLAEKLDEAENAGLISKTLANREDHPTITWRSNLPKKTQWLKQYLSFWK